MVLRAPVIEEGGDDEVEHGVGGRRNGKGGGFIERPASGHAGAHESVASSRPRDDPTAVIAAGPLERMTCVTCPLGTDGWVLCQEQCAEGGFRDEPLTATASPIRHGFR